VANRVCGPVLAPPPSPGAPADPGSGRSSNSPLRSPRVVAFIACATRSSNSAWLSRPSAKWAARRSPTSVRSASEARMCWSV
jgi:hypothetical protein